MRGMLKGILFSAFITFGMGMMACCETSCNTSCCETSCDDTCCDATCCSGGSYFGIRSQSWNAARELVGWQQFINKFEMESVYGAFTITPEYTRSFRPCRIAGFLFGQDLQNGVLTVSGSRKGVTGAAVADGTARASTEWLADYFGLPTDFHSEVRFTPRISNFIVDLNLYLGFDELFEGAYMRVHAPIVYTKWQLNMCEDVKVKGERDFDAGYMDSTLVARANLPESFEAAMKGVKWGDMQEALKYGKIDCCKLTKTRLSDIHLTLGWNFLQDEDYHFGLNVRAGFPTGNKATGTYLFEPIVGNGGHFELGGGLTASARLWTSDDEESSFYVYMDANVAHLFKRKLVRSFDLTNRPNSRYMLIQEMSSPAANLYGGAAAGSTTASDYEYADALFPLINKSTCCTDVSVAVMGEAAIKFAYNWNSWSFDLGYNIWGRTGEKRCQGCSLDANKYALKGDAFVYGFTDANSDAVAGNTGFPLAATENSATINAGTNTVSGTAFALADRANPRIDNVQLAWAADAATNELHVTTAGTTQTNTSIQPTFLKATDFNTGKTSSALSHKVFAHVSYAWIEDEEVEDDWVPFIGLGGEAEFGSKNSGCYNAVSQWGVWVKGGLAFN